MPTLFNVHRIAETPGSNKNSIIFSIILFIFNLVSIEYIYESAREARCAVGAQIAPVCDIELAKYHLTQALSNYIRDTPHGRELYEKLLLLLNFDLIYRASLNLFNLMRSKPSAKTTPAFSVKIPHFANSTLQN